MHSHVFKRPERRSKLLADHLALLISSMSGLLCDGDDLDET